MATLRELNSFFKLWKLDGIAAIESVLSTAIKVFSLKFEWFVMMIS